MYFVQRRHSPYYAAQLLSPSFAYMLANPEERLTCSPSSTSSTMNKRAQGQPQPQPEDTTKRSTEMKTEGFFNSYIHVVEEKDRFILYTDLPGVKVNDVKVKVTDQSVLSIHGERKKGEETLTLDRQFMIDDQLVEVSKITANMEDGTLQITAPKKEVSTPRMVAVVGGSPSAEEE